MELDPVLIGVVAVALAVFLFAFILRLFGQPHVVGYIIIGAIIGWLGIVDTGGIIAQLGNLGIVLLLFFIGMHISLPKLMGSWRVAVLGTIAQIILTVLVFWGIGSYLGWPIERVLLFGFVVSLSSTAVVLKILQEWGELNTRVGQNVLGILLVQDLAIVPMLLILEFSHGGVSTIGDLLVPLIGGVAILGLVVWVVRRGGLSLPFLKRLREDHEMQVFLALILCFGLALLTGVLGLSPAFGAFVAGFLVKQLREASWVQESLESLHVILVALFFIYVGMLMDLSFIADNAGLVIAFTLFILVMNTALNTAIIRLLGDTWKESLYAGGLLSQVGEFSFLIVGVGFARNFISETGYQLVIAVIAISLLISPLWIQGIKRALHIDASYVFELPGKIITAVAEGDISQLKPRKRKRR